MPSDSRNVQDIHTPLQPARPSHLSTTVLGISFLLQAERSGYPDMTVQSPLLNRDGSGVKATAASTLSGSTGSLTIPTIPK